MMMQMFSHAASGAIAVPAAPVKAVGRDWWKSLVRAFLDHQQARANRLIRVHLARHDDASLASLGFSAKEISGFRRRADGEAD